MTRGRRAASGAAATAYAVLTFAAIVGPAVVIRLAAVRNGVEGAAGLDLVVGSALVGVVHAVRMWRRLHATHATPALLRTRWLAELNALVVLGLAATLLITTILTGFASFHAGLAADGYPVVALWIGVQVVAVALSELAGCGMYRWLAAHPDLLHDLVHHHHRHAPTDATGVDASVGVGAVEGADDESADAVSRPGGREVARR